jgi:hypothetical protein
MNVMRCTSAKHIGCAVFPARLPSTRPGPDAIQTLLAWYLAIDVPLRSRLAMVAFPGDVVSFVRHFVASRIGFT